MNRGKTTAVPTEGVLGSSVMDLPPDHPCRPHTAPHDHRDLVCHHSPSNLSNSCFPAAFQGSSGLLQVSLHSRCILEISCGNEGMQRRHQSCGRDVTAGQQEGFSDTGGSGSWSCREQNSLCGTAVAMIPWKLLIPLCPAWGCWKWPPPVW